MTFSFSRPGRRSAALLLLILLMAAAWLTVPATGNQFLQRMLGGPRGRGPAAGPRHEAPEEQPRTGPELVDSPLDVQGAPRLPRALIQQSVQASNGQSTLDQLVARAIELTSRRCLDVQQDPPYTPWQIMHGVLALRENYILKRGNQHIRALDYISSGPVFMGDCWFQRTSTGARARPYNNVPYAFEGHINQFLALLAMSNLPLDHQIRVSDGGYVTMQDMVNTAQSTVNAREEITWTLWFLTHYTDQLSQWTNNEGESWSIERMLRVQIDDPVYSAPCGGCHGLFALAYARNAYLVQHGELRGVWLEADQKVQRYIAAAQSMQNADGSFSSKYFKSRATAIDLDERIRTSGHMFEWLMMALPSSRLEEEWVRRGAARIATDLINSVNDDTEMGGMYHACHSLLLYQQRMEQIRSRDQSPQPEQLADVPGEQEQQPIEIQSPEPAPLSLPENSSVAELPQRDNERDDEVVAQTPITPPATAEETPDSRVPLIVGDLEPEVPPAILETHVLPRPEIARNTPPLILSPDALQDSPPTSSAAEPVEPANPAPADRDVRPGIPLIVSNDPPVESPVPAPGEPENVATDAEPQSPVTEEATDNQTPAPRVFSLTMPEATGNHKPRSATTAAPAQPGSRPVTGAAPIGAQR